MTRQASAGYAFVSPALLAIAVLFLAPSLAALALSLTDFDIYALGDWRTVRFVGLDSFRALLTEPLFWRALLNTLVLAGLGVPMAVGASLGAALLLDSPHLRWRALWRTALFAPYVTTLVATAVVWRYLFDARFGLINRGLALLGVAPVDWLGDPRTSIPAILLFVTWKVFGYNMVVFSAALASVPQDLKEAARLDGAGPLQRFRTVTLPAIGPVLLLAALMSVAGFLQIFDEPYVMTQGGPAQSTLTLTYFLFNRGFEWWSLGSASAVAVVLLALTLLVNAVQQGVGRRRGWL